MLDLSTHKAPFDIALPYGLTVTVKPLTTAGMGAAQAKLVLTAHEVYLPKPKLAVEGPGGVQASFDFRGAKNTAAGRMLTITLTNDLDGLVYA